MAGVGEPRVVVGASWRTRGVSGKKAPTTYPGCEERHHPPSTIHLVASHFRRPTRAPAPPASSLQHPRKTISSLPRGLGECVALFVPPDDPAKTKSTSPAHPFGIVNTTPTPAASSTSPRPRRFVTRLGHWTGTKGLGRLTISDLMRPSERLDEAAGGDRGKEAG